MRKILVITAMSPVVMAALVGCGRRQETKVEEPPFRGYTIAKIDSTYYFWMQLSDDSARISVVRNRELVKECIVRGPVQGAYQGDNGEVYIWLDDDYSYSLDVSNLPSRLGLLPSNCVEGYDSSNDNMKFVVGVSRTETE